MKQEPTNTNQQPGFFKEMLNFFKGGLGVGLGVWNNLWGWLKEQVSDSPRLSALFASLRVKDSATGEYYNSEPYDEALDALIAKPSTTAPEAFKTPSIKDLGITGIFAPRASGEDTTVYPSPTSATMGQTLDKGTLTSTYDFRKSASPDIQEVVEVIHLEPKIPNPDQPATTPAPTPIGK